MGVYNDSKYLGLAIESILSQTFSDFEFLIFDDGSTDGSAKILDEYAAKDPRVKIIHQQNIGLTKTLNKGIKMAKGEYIARMDSDDISLPERFKKQVAFLDGRPDVAVISTFTKVIDKNGNEIGRHTPGTSHENIKKMSFFSGQLSHPAAMMRLSAIKEIGGYDEKVRYAQDYDLWLRVMRKYKVANIPEFLFLWRKTSGGIGQAKKKEQLGFAQVAKKQAIDNGLYPKYYYVFLVWPHIRGFIPPGLKNKIKGLFE
jgi:glycosyltransferase involved in cell wall biosynthesis